MTAESFIHALILLGGVQGVALGVWHILRPSLPPWTRWLGWALATHALSDVHLWLYWHRTALDLRLLMLLPLNVVLVPVYCLFRYVQAFTGAERIKRTFGGWLAGVAGLEIIIYLLPAGAALYTGNVAPDVFSFAKTIRNVLTLGSLPVVLLTCWTLNQMIRRYGQLGGAGATFRERLRWLQHLFTGVCVVYALAQLPMVLTLLGYPPSRAWFYPLGIGSSLFLVWAGIRAIMIHERLANNELAPTDVADAPTPSAQAALYGQALRLLTQEELYKQPNLKLADVATRLSVSPHYLSRVVNQQADKSFTDWVNEQRVAAVQRMMADPAHHHFTLEGLGREAGFAAKSTYQAAFKRLTGQTPSQYRAALRPVS